MTDLGPALNGQETQGDVEPACLHRGCEELSSLEGRSGGDFESPNERTGDPAASSRALDVQSANSPNCRVRLVGVAVQAADAYEAALLERSQELLTGLFKAIRALPEFSQEAVQVVMTLGPREDGQTRELSLGIVDRLEVHGITRLERRGRLDIARGKHRIHGSEPCSRHGYLSAWDSLGALAPSSLLARLASRIRSWKMISSERGTRATQYGRSVGP